MGLTFPEVLTRLLARQDLSREEAEEAMSHVLSGETTPAQIAGLLVALRAKEPSVNEMTGMVDALLGASVRLELPVDAIDAIDTCGTGGSEQRRTAAFHCSTLAGLVAAGAGAKVCKHGNRRASATSGSADLLEALGVAIDLGPDGVARCVAEAGMGFCLAPAFHPGMRHAGPVRRELGVRTIVNFVAPLANPARVRRQVVGVSDAAMAPKVAAVLAARGALHAMVVHGSDGLDELTTTGPSTVIEVREGDVEMFEVDPAALGLAKSSVEELRGGDTQANVAIATRVLSGEKGAHRDIVVLNASAALVVADAAAGFEEGIAAAARSLDSGSAMRVLDDLIRVSRACASD